MELRSSMFCSVCRTDGIFSRSEAALAGHNVGDKRCRPDLSSVNGCFIITLMAEQVTFSDKHVASTAGGPFILMAGQGTPSTEVKFGLHRCKIDE